MVPESPRNPSRKRSISRPAPPASRELRHVAFYPGSFDPPTFGHLDVIARGRRIFDELVVGIGQNPGKKALFSVAERIDMLRRLIENMEVAPGAATPAPVRVESYSGLTVDFAREVGATVLLRGIRNLSDLQYEIQQAVTNREVAGLETAFVVAGQSFAYTSSTLIRQIAALGEDLNVLAPLCPPLVIDMLRRKKARRPAILKKIAEDA